MCIRDSRFDVFSFSVDRSPIGPEAPFTGPVDLLSAGGINDGSEADA